MNFNSLEKHGRVDFQCSFTNEVIIIYNGKLGSRFIDGKMKYKNKYHVIIDLSKSPNIQVKARPIYFGTDLEANITPVDCEETSKFLQSVFVGKSNKRDVIFVYRDPWEKYKSGIYQDYPSRLKNEKQKGDVLKYLDTLILHEQPELSSHDPYFDMELKGCIFTGHSQRILITYKAILNKTNIAIDRCKFFNMELYGLEDVLQIYGLDGDEDKLSRNRSGWTENKNFRKFFYDTFELSRHRKVIKKIMKEEIENYKWFESHKRNFTNFHKATIKK